MGGDRRGYDSYASRALNERCLVYRPVPVRSSGYNNNNQIVQGPGYVAMMQEQIHETRIIPLDGRPFTGDSIRPWLGVSRGHWEGDTLVVETRNFHPDSNYEGSGPNRVVIERFTRTAARPNELRVHGHRPDDVGAAVYGADAVAHRRRPDLRVRLPRGQLRHGESASR